MKAKMILLIPALVALSLAVPVTSRADVFQDAIREGYRSNERLEQQLKEEARERELDQRLRRIEDRQRKLIKEQKDRDNDWTIDLDDY